MKGMKGDGLVQTVVRAMEIVRLEVRGLRYLSGRCVGREGWCWVACKSTVVNQMIMALTYIITASTHRITALTYIITALTHTITALTRTRS